LEIRVQAADEWAEVGGIVGAIISTIDQLLPAVNIVDMMTDALGNLVQGLKQAIATYILYGKSVGETMRMVLAATLAQIAAEAAVQAIRAAAYGFLYLAMGDYVAAANAFVSAAMWGVLAVGAAALGQAIAPKREQAQAAAGLRSQSSATSTQRDTSGQGQAFSSKEDEIRNTDISGPARGILSGEVTIRVESNDSHIVRVVQNDYNNNGRLRMVMRQATNEG
jgi:hypothetical protein